MTALLIFALSLAALGIVAALVSRFRTGDEAHPAVRAEGGCATCDGSSTKCEKECMAEASAKPIEYFDDEELDRYAHRPSDAYSDEEAEQFRYVLYTMRPDEVPRWSRSLTLRGINVPDQVKDELLLLING